jgi:hypothetical protein
MKYAVALVAVLALTGCAVIQGQTAADSEEILAQAGFQRQPLEGPGLPARQLIEDRGAYRFADPDFCRCEYVGGAKEYAELQRLRTERIANRNWDLQHSGYGNAWSPAVWSAWNPEGLDAIKSPIVSTDTQARPEIH